jgi:hypothetical protein
MVLHMVFFRACLGLAKHSTAETLQQYLYTDWVWQFFSEATRFQALASAKNWTEQDGQS